MLALIALALAAPAIDPPRTVNGEVLGTAEEFTTAGPARVCIRSLMITANRDESVSLAYAGIHNGELRLNRGNNWVSAALGESWVTPRQRGDVIERRPDSYIADISDDKDLRYGLFASGGDGEGYYLLVRIRGPAFTGDERDRSILRRIELREPQSPACDVDYNFGWPMLEGEEPVREPGN